MRASVRAAPAGAPGAVTGGTSALEAEASDVAPCGLVPFELAGTRWSAVEQGRRQLLVVPVGRSCRCSANAGCARSAPTECSATRRASAAEGERLLARLVDGLNDAMDRLLEPGAM